MKLMDEFGPLLPPTTDFQIGFFSGRQSTKYWLMCQKDLDNMNKCVEKIKGTMMLCDGKSASESTASGSRRKKKADEPPS